MAAKGAKARAAARKQRDKWKAKRWYTIRAPRLPWQYKVIGETLGETAEHLLGRIYETTQNEVDGDFSKMNVKLRFRVTETRGEDALTEFIGSAIGNDHVRRQIRRHRGRVDDVIDCVTADGYYIRMKPTVIASARLKTSQKSQIRKLMRDSILQHTASHTWLDVQKGLLGTSMEQLIIDAIKNVNPTKSVMMRKVQLIQSGVVADDGPTLEEVFEDEKRANAEMAAKKAAALEKAMAEEAAAESELDEAEEADDSNSDVEADGSTEASDVVIEEESEEAEAEVAEAGDAAVDLSGKTVAQLKEMCREAGKPVSGKKADLISRLAE